MVENSLVFITPVDRAFTRDVSDQGSNSSHAYMNVNLHLPPPSSVPDHGQDFSKMIVE